MSHQTKVFRSWLDGTRLPNDEVGFDPPRRQVSRRWVIAGVAGTFLLSACGGSQQGSSKGSTSSSQPVTAPTAAQPVPTPTQPKASQISSAGVTVQTGSTAALPSGVPKDLVYPGAQVTSSIIAGTGYMVGISTGDPVGHVVAYYKSVLSKSPYKNLATQTTTSGNASRVILMFDNAEPNGIAGTVLIGSGASADTKGKTEIALEIGRKK